MLLTPITFAVLRSSIQSVLVHPFLVLLFFFAMFINLFSTLAYATEIYTWVDEHGVTHYSQEPPEQKQVTKIYSEDIKPAKIGSVSPKAPVTTKAEASELEKIATSIKGSDNAQAKVICDNAKHSLNVLISHSKLNKQNKETGESIAMTEEQRQTAIKEQKQRISLFCSK